LPNLVRNQNLIELIQECQAIEFIKMDEWSRITDNNQSQFTQTPLSPIQHLGG
jgi:hypothetical protein